MSENLSILLSQINPIVGDVNYNFEKISSVIKKADNNTDLIVFPEMVLSGYPPEDLVYRNSFLSIIDEHIKKIAELTKGKNFAIILGTPLKRDEKLYNSAVFIENGKIKKEIYKTELPNYGVFDEVRLFEKGQNTTPIDLKGHKIGVLICEDLWFEKVSSDLKKNGAEILISINGSPFELNKAYIREEIGAKRVEDTNLPLIYLNLFGGQDELVFDGRSYVMNGDKEIVCKLNAWEEQNLLTVWEKDTDNNLCCKTKKLSPVYSHNEEVYQAMVTGLKDYVNKVGFKGVVLGMSGGIDSALSAAVAVDALGADRVKLFMMPSPYTSKESLDDAKKAGEMLGCEVGNIPILPAMNAFDEMFCDIFKGQKKDITEENIQARIRGVSLMAYSNKFGYMVLSTGNKSENSVGYATLYGDMCGGFNAIKDVYKTSVFDVCKWRNENKPKNTLGKSSKVMPDNIITKPPTAELREDQKDEDSLPPYEVLDAILKLLIEKEMGVDEIIKKGYEIDTVKKVWWLLKTSEYKRRQSAPGVKITSCSFGKERRYPIVNKF